jgi:hypothetical protein
MVAMTSPQYSTEGALLQNREGAHMAQAGHTPGTTLAAASCSWHESPCGRLADGRERTSFRHLKCF